MTDDHNIITRPSHAATPKPNTTTMINLSYAALR
jgi:hypothetical protein